MMIGIGIGIVYVALAAGILLFVRGAAMLGGQS